MRVADYKVGDKVQEGQLCEYRKVKRGDKVINYFSDTVYIAGRDSDSLLIVPIDPPEENDIAWAMREMKAKPAKAFTWGDGGGRHYRWSMNRFEVQSRRDNPWEPINEWSDHAVGATDWREVEPEPKGGIAEWLRAQPEGTAVWYMAARDMYYKIIGSELHQIDTVTGDVKDKKPLTWWFINGWSLILDANGKPAEPVVHSQLWAQICCRDLGLDVVHATCDGFTRWGKNAAGEMDFMHHAADGVVHRCLCIMDHYGIQTGWSLRKQPNNELMTLRDDLTRLNAEFVALNDKVNAALKGGK